jgi:hypothetical protein
MEKLSGVPKERVRVVASSKGVLEVTLPYRPDWIARIKTLSGRRWDPERRLWTVPDSRDGRAALLDLFAGVLDRDDMGGEPLERARHRTPPRGRGGVPPDGRFQEPASFEVAGRTRGGEGPPAGGRIEVTRSPGYLWLVCTPYFQRWIDWIRTLERSRWDPSRRAWAVPDTAENRRRIEEGSAELTIAFCESSTAAAASPLSAPETGPSVMAQDVPASVALDKTYAHRPEMCMTA